MRRRTSITFVHLLVVLTSFVQSALVPLLPDLSRHYGLGEAAAGLLLVLPSVAIFVVSLPVGLLAHRWGSSGLTCAAGVLLIISCLAQAVPAVLALVVGRVCFGLAYGIVLTSAPTWVAESGDDQPGRAFTAITTSAAAGLVLGPVLAAVLATRFGPGSPFLFGAVVATPLTGALWLAGNRPGPRSIRTATAREMVPAAVALRRALSRPLIAAGAAGLALCGAVNVVVQLLASWQLRHSGESVDAVGAAFSAAAMLFVVASAGVVGAGPRAATPRFAAATGCGLVLTLLAATLGGRAGWVLATLLLTTALRGLLGTLAFPLAMREESCAAGLAVGLLNGAWAAAMLIAAVVAGLVSQAFGPGPAYLATAVLGGVIAAVILGAASGRRLVVRS